MQLPDAGVAELFDAGRNTEAHTTGRACTLWRLVRPEGSLKKTDEYKTLFIL